MGSGVWGLGSWVWGLGLGVRVWVLGCMGFEGLGVEGSGGDLASRVRSGVWVLVFGVGVWGLGSGVWGLGVWGLGSWGWAS